MNDRAPEVAAYFVERQPTATDTARLWIELRERWPDLTVEEAERGARIADEILAARIAENEAVIDTVRVRLTTLAGGSARHRRGEDTDHAD